MYLPGCPPRPEMLMDAILKLHQQIQDSKLGPDRRREVQELEQAALVAAPTRDLKGLLR
jgi:NADH-quinone oxidoreductase subunit B